jgi:hypothetical protein
MNLTLADFPSGGYSICERRPKVDYTWFAKAVCKSDNIKVFNTDTLKKETVAYIVVFIDIGICLLLFYLFEYLRGVQAVINSEITDQTVEAEDFSVEIRNLPPHHDVIILKTQLWSWIESLVPPSKLMNIHFGTTDMSEMDSRMDIA